MSASTPERWHGIPRQEVPWYPTVDAQACIGCELCYVTCGRAVYDIRDRKAVATRPYACMVGCTTCAMVCPTDAIHFPNREVVRRVEREYKILRIVKEEARAKRGRQDALKARAAAEAAQAGLTSRTHMELAGEFGDKRFLVQLEQLIADHPVDLVNLQLQVPTVKGLMERTPAFMSFEVTSTQQEDIQAFLPSLRDLARSNGFTLVNEVNV
ncbi:MAG: ferredoxin family protein [Geothrix sp.]|nr:ferredoxin family protein [Geothrix sp.]